jgi:WXG100 family type VII secretion target
MNMGAVSEVTATMSSISNEIREHLSTLERSIKNMVESWEGDAKVEYVRIQREWSSGVDGMVHAFDHANKTARMVSDEYGSTDAQNRAKFQNTL